jgi:hypothetical protein
MCGVLELGLGVQGFRFRGKSGGSGIGFVVWGLGFGAWTLEVGV